MSADALAPSFVCIASALACIYAWRRELNASRLVAALFGAAIALSAAMLVAVGVPSAAALTLASVTGLCITICEVDRRHFIIPDVLVVCLLLTALVTPFVSRLDQAFGATLVGGLFLVVRESFVRLRGFHGLGLGDVKLAAVIGALLGPTLGLVAIAAAAGATAIALYLTQRRESSDLSQRKAPLGVGLSAALALALVFEVCR